MSHVEVQFYRRGDTPPRRGRSPSSHQLGRPLALPQPLKASVTELVRKGRYYARYLIWWRQRGSNPRPHACKARALPTELCPQYLKISIKLSNGGSWPIIKSNHHHKNMVGLGGLEPPTSRLSGVRSNQAELQTHPWLALPMFYPNICLSALSTLSRYGGCAFARNHPINLNFLKEICRQRPLLFVLSLRYLSTDYK